MIPRARSSGALSISSYFLNLAPPPSSKTKGKEENKPLRPSSRGRGRAQATPKSLPPTTQRTVWENNASVIPSVSSCSGCNSGEKEMLKGLKVQLCDFSRIKPLLTGHWPRLERGHSGSPPQLTHHKILHVQGKCVSCIFQSTARGHNTSRAPGPASAAGASGRPRPIPAYSS